MARKHSDPNRNYDRGPKLTLYHKGFSYRVNVEQIKSNTIDFDKALVCPHCDHKLAVTTELIKYGADHDDHTYTFLCKSCLIGFMYLCSIPVETE